MTKLVVITNPEVASRGKLTTAEEFSAATKPGPGEKTEISFWYACPEKLGATIVHVVESTSVKFLTGVSPKA
jgi:hypothetical protein